MKASILAIGTELTTGQIINKNAATLSAKLKTFGIVVTAHLTVPDDKQIILDSFKFLEERTDVLFVTGGLGPTSDDFTRDVIAEWTRLPMKFDEKSWQYIQERLSSRGFAVRDMQRQQCYFPEGAEILENSEGTAHGFKFNFRNKIVYVLPGPPREIEAIFRSHIHADLERKTKGLTKLITRAWDTIGTAESEIAHQVEEILKNPPAAVDIGYRVHLPYVEIKLSFSETDQPKFAPIIKAVDDALNGVCVSRDFFDIIAGVTKKISGVDFTFYDYVSEGYLHGRLGPYAKDLKNWSFKQSTQTSTVDLFENEDNFLALLPFEEDQCILIHSFQGVRRQKTLIAPMKSPLMSERRRQYFAEMALVEFGRTQH